MSFMFSPILSSNKDIKGQMQLVMSMELCSVFGKLIKFTYAKMNKICIYANNQTDSKLFCKRCLRVTSTSFPPKYFTNGH
jgi:hypothetical protein